MGLFDSLLGSLLGNLQPHQQTGLMDAAANILGEHGGLGGLLGKFSQHGLGDLVSSWVSNGRNLPVTGDQLHQVLGADKIAQIASQLGFSGPDAAHGLAQVLPELINKLTPNGAPISHEETQSGLAGLLSGGLGKLFGK